MPARKKRIRRRAAGLLLAFLFWLPVSGEGRECESLRVGSTDGWLPVAYIDQQTGVPAGIAHDFTRYVGERLGLPVEIHADIPWKRVLQRFEAGSLDMAAAIYWNREREKMLKYTDHYFTNEARIFVKKGEEFPFTRLEDLLGRTGGIPHGGSFGDAFDTFAAEHDLELEGVATKVQMAQKVLADRNDYFIQDYLDGMLFLKQQGLRGEIVPLPYPVATTRVYFALSRQSPCVSLVSSINAIIGEAKQDGTLEKIIMSYIGEDPL